MKLFGKKKRAIEFRRAGALTDKEFVGCFAAGPNNALWNGVEEVLGRLEDEMLGATQAMGADDRLKREVFDKVGALREVRAQMYANYEAVRKMVEKEEE